MTKGSERIYIVKILEDIQKKSLYVNQVIDDYFYVYEFDKNQRSFISKVVYGSIENQLLIDYMINRLSKVKVKKMKPVIRHIMRMTGYQILFMDKVPAHACINEAVKIVKKRKMHQLSGFVNGVLRNLDRQKEDLWQGLEDLPLKKRMSLKYSVSEELINHLMNQYDGESLEQFLQASITNKTTVIRANRNKSRHLELEQVIGTSGELTKSPIIKGSYRLSNYDRLINVKGFDQGLFQVQDESSSLVGLIANPKSSDRILDTCASPGGKSTHMAELMGDQGKVVSCDVSESKINRIHENIERLGLQSVDTIISDATRPNADFNEAFDIVVSDVPCSGLGILRNKPDIKLNMTLDKMKSLVKLQRDVVANTISYVKVGGSFIYSTCTINKEENIEQVKWILDSFPDLELVDLTDIIQTSSEIVAKEYLLDHLEKGCLQLMTSVNMTDGFFIAKFIKKD